MLVNDETCVKPVSHRDRCVERCDNCIDATRKTLYIVRYFFDTCAFRVQGEKGIEIIRF